MDDDESHPWVGTVYDRHGQPTTRIWLHSLRALLARLDADHREPAAIATSWRLRERAYLHRHATGWAVAARYPMGDEET
jgi:hypothetical protein